jgi:hypothetical protein
MVKKTKFGFKTLLTKNKKFCISFRYNVSSRPHTERIFTQKQCADLLSQVLQIWQRQQKRDVSYITLQQWINFCLSSIEGLVVHLLYGVDTTVIPASISIHSGSQGLILGKTIRNLLQKKCQLAWFFPAYFGFPCQNHSTNAPHSEFIYLPLMLPNLSNWQHC